MNELTHIQHYNQLQIQSVGKYLRFDKRTDVSHDLVETSSAQTQYQVQQEGIEDQYMTQVPKRFYGQITYDDQKQTYIFVANNTLVPLENNMYIIFHEPNKKKFQYDQKTMQFKQTCLHECEWSTRYLLCQDVSVCRITGVNYNTRQGQTLDYTDQPMKQKIHDHTNTQGRDEHVSYRQDNDLCVKVPNEDIETGQRQDFNDYELIQQEYLTNLEMPNNKEQTYPPENVR